MKLPSDGDAWHPLATRHRFGSSHPRIATIKGAGCVCFLIIDSNDEATTTRLSSGCKSNTKALAILVQSNQRPTATKRTRHLGCWAEYNKPNVCSTAHMHTRDPTRPESIRSDACVPLYSARRGAFLSLPLSSLFPDSNRPRICPVPEVHVCAARQAASAPRLRLTPHPTAAPLWFFPSASPLLVLSLFFCTLYAPFSLGARLLLARSLAKAFLRFSSRQPRMRTRASPSVIGFSPASQSHDARR